MLNVDIKILFKALAKRLKEVLPCLISAQQTAYVQNRNIGESRRLISDIIEIANTRQMEGFLATMDVEKAFDSLDHKFLVSVLKRIGFGQNFISWIEIILKNQESCVINGGTTTKYFKLNRGTRQGDPISAYLFILAFEILFLLIKENPHIKGLNIFDHCYLYSAYADDTTFFLKDVNSIKEMVNKFHIFSRFSGVRPNLSKCEIAGIVCGIQSVDLVLDTIKILGTHFSYNEKLKEEINSCLIIANIQLLLKLWKLQNLTLEGKILIFKTLVLSKIIFQAFVTPIPIDVVTELEKIQKSFLRENSTSKIKHDTLCNDYKDGGLKNVDIRKKIIGLQCLWIKRLYDDSFHEWKIIPFHLISRTFGKLFIFHSNLSFKKKLIKSFPSFYKEIFLNWKTFFSKTPETPSSILSQVLWYNIYIQIDEGDVYLSRFSQNNLNVISQLFNTNCLIKAWHLLKQEYHLNNNSYFQWLQLINSVPEKWKLTIKQSSSDAKNLIIHGHHLIKGSRILILEKLTSKELYQILISSRTDKVKSVT